jgi:hypothetical protein
MSGFQIVIGVRVCLVPCKAPIMIGRIMTYSVKNSFEVFSSRSLETVVAPTATAEGKLFADEQWRTIREWSAGRVAGSVLRIGAAEEFRKVVESVAVGIAVWPVVDVDAAVIGRIEAVGGFPSVWKIIAVSIRIERVCLGVAVDFVDVRDAVLIEVGGIDRFPGWEWEVGVFEAEEGFAGSCADFVTDIDVIGSLDHGDPIPFSEGKVRVRVLDEVGAPGVSVPPEKVVSARDDDDFGILVGNALLGTGSRGREKG